MGKKEEEKQARTAGEFNYRFLRRIYLQFAISASLVSLCLWCSTGCSLVPHSLNFGFTTFLFSIFSRTLERKYMFLICNGILAFLAKSSLCNSSVMSVTGDELSSLDASDTGDIVSGAMMPAGKSNTDESHENLILAAEVHDLEPAHTDSSEEQKVIGLVARMEDIENDEDSSEEQMWRQEEEEEEGKDQEGPESEVPMTAEDDVNSEPTSTTTANEEYAIASTDELNRKFEEFIRKMKEEIRVETQKQIIVV